MLDHPMNFGHRGTGDLATNTCISACPAAAAAPGAPYPTRKGTTGVSTNGVTAIIFMFFDRGTLCVLPLTYFYLPKSARAYLFPQCVKIYYFCNVTISVDPICPQPSCYTVLDRDSYPSYQTHSSESQYKHTHTSTHY